MGVNIFDFSGMPRAFKSTVLTKLAPDQKERRPCELVNTAASIADPPVWVLHTYEETLGLSFVDVNHIQTIFEKSYPTSGLFLVETDEFGLVEEYEEVIGSVPLKKWRLVRFKHLSSPYGNSIANNYVLETILTPKPENPPQVGGKIFDSWILDGGPVTRIAHTNAMLEYAELKGLGLHGPYDRVKPLQLVEQAYSLESLVKTHVDIGFCFMLPAEESFQRIRQLSYLNITHDPEYLDTLWCELNRLINENDNIHRINVAGPMAKADEIIDEIYDQIDYIMETNRENLT